jgi:ureidoacrylate peracid hydrolase
MPFTIDPSRTAVIVVDMQNDCAREGGAFARAGLEIVPVQNIIAPTARVLAAARDTA